MFLTMLFLKANMKMNINIAEILNGEYNTPLPQDVLDYIEHKFHLSNFESKKKMYLSLMTVEKNDLLDHLRIAYDLITFWRSLFLGMVAQVKPENLLIKNELSIKNEPFGSEDPINNNLLDTTWEISPISVDAYIHYDEYNQIRETVPSFLKEEERPPPPEKNGDDIMHSACSEPCVSPLDFKNQTMNPEIIQFSTQNGTKIVQKRTEKVCAGEKVEESLRKPSGKRKIVAMKICSRPKRFKESSQAQETIKQEQCGETLNGKSEDYLSQKTKQHLKVHHRREPFTCPPL